MKIRTLPVKAKLPHVGDSRGDSSPAMLKDGGEDGRPGELSGEPMPGRQRRHTEYSWGDPDPSRSLVT